MLYLLVGACGALSSLVAEIFENHNRMHVIEACKPDTRASGAEEASSTTQFPKFSSATSALSAQEYWQR